MRPANFFCLLCDRRVGHSGECATGHEAREADDEYLESLACALALDLGREAEELRAARFAVEVWQRDAADAQAEADAARADAEKLRAHLRDALDGWDEAADYKGEYLRAKHEDTERIAEIRAAVAALLAEEVADE